MRKEGSRFWQGHEVQIVKPFDPFVSFGEKNVINVEMMIWTSPEIRDREKVTRNLKKADTPILAGYQIFHNYVRPHMALEGKTPAEVAGITVKGQNKWITLIQNATKNARIMS